MYTDIRKKRFWLQPAGDGGGPEGGAHDAAGGVAGVRDARRLKPGGARGRHQEDAPVRHPSIHSLTRSPSQTKT
eukprot:2250566-Pyramimonas_sp.AAC.1